MLAPQQQPDFAAMRAEIEAAREVPELVHIIGQAKASRAYYKQAKDAENSWQSFQFQLRAERKAGQLLIEMNEAGVRTKGRAVPGFKVGSPTGQPTLAQLGVSRMESQTLQQLAKVPAPAFEAALADPAAARIMRANAVTPGGQKAREGLGEAKIRNIALSSISISSRLRALRPDKVDEFAESMRDRRLINPITVRRLDDGGHRLIAGHHRLEAARKLGWEGIPAIIFKGIDAVDAELLEIDENLVRADLTPAEQAAHHKRRKELHEQKHPETKRTATLKRGQEKAPSRQNGETENRYTRDTAEKTGASERTVQRHVERGTSIPNVSELAGTCLDQGAELDALAKLKDVAPDRQANLIEQAKAGEKVSALAEIKKVQRAKREAELGHAQAAGNLKLPDQRYGVILVDWPRKPLAYSDETGADRSPANHYAVHDFAWAINVLAPMIDKLAAPDCMLAFWSTAASLLDDIEIMAEAGFCALRPRDTAGHLLRDKSGGPLEPVSPGGGSYRSHQVWDKQAIGLGRWFRDRHELLLVGVRGTFPAPAPGTQGQSLFSERRGKHSAKPEFVADELDRLWPSLPKIELFRRGQARAEWAAWGNEANVAADRAAPIEEELPLSPDDAGGGCAEMIVGEART
jgi:ParB-like chromosome segregation protein Spo0J/N6-adenosine-specific RNA methylase IME4